MNQVTGTTSREVEHFGITRDQDIGLWDATIAKPAFEHIAKVGAARRRQNNDSWCAGNLKGQPLAVCPRARGLRSLPQRTDRADGV